MNRILFSSIIFLVSTGFAQTTYQAENADFVYHGIVESEHAGYTGGGYVNLDNEIGSYIQYIVSMAQAGQQNLDFTFAQGTTGQDRKMELSVNGQVISEVSFPYTEAWTTWSVQSIAANLDSGANVIRLRSITSDGGPNLDKMDVSGEAGEIYFHLRTGVEIGSGSVFVIPDDSIFAANTLVSVTAIPDANYNFLKWACDTSGSSNPLTFSLLKSLNIKSVFLQDNISLPADTLIGWASLNGGTTGGAGGTIVSVSNQSQLENYATKSGSYVIQIEGTIVITPYGKEINIGSNKTIVGIGTNATIKNGGLGVKSVNNVIVRNLIIRDTYVTWEGKDTDYDGIEINNSRNVWIDHCDITHCDDGAIDVKNMADYVTISWCHFYNHNKVMLIGASDDATQDIGHLNTTIHHCWFDGTGGNGLGQRLPRARFGKVHVFNNYYNDIIYSGAMAGFDADMRVENNYFLNTPDPHPVVGGVEGGDNKLNAGNNIYVNSTGRADSRGTAFVPLSYYSYTINNPEDVPVLVIAGAGPQNVTALERIQSYYKPESITLFQNYPNPFNPSTTIQYEIKNSGFVELSIFDITGKRVQTLVKQFQKAGNYQIKWVADRFSNGVYYYCFKSGEIVKTRKMLLVK